jgi:hypothetical protein
VKARGASARLVRSVSRVESARFKETGLESAVVHYFGWLALSFSLSFSETETETETGRVPIMRLAASHFSLLIEFT